MIDTVAHVRIERIVLTGIEMDPARVEQFRERLASELGGALRRRNVSWKSCTAGRVTAPPVPVSQAEDDRLLAARIAGSIVEGLEVIQKA
jgi:hypothetical protein